MSLPFGFVDIHSHVIPNLDDGPAELETAVALVRAASDGGTAVLVATGHSEEIIQTGGGRDAMERRLHTVREAVADAGIAITLLLGAEIYLESDTPARLQRGEVFPINGSRYILVELPFQALPIYLDQTLFQLQTAGYVPVIAHPERSAPIQVDPQPLYDWVTRGSLVQISAASLTGGFGRAAARVARLAVSHHLCHAVASDAHDPVHRAPLLAPAFALLRDEFGLEVARSLLVIQPRAIVENATLSPADPQPIQPESNGGFFQRFFRRR